MVKPFTLKTPQYHIMGLKGEHFDVFNKRGNAIKEAIKLASEYPGATFLVIKRVHNKDKTIFSFKIDADVNFEDLVDMYDGVLEAFKIKKDKTQFWRKS